MTSKVIGLTGAIATGKSTAGNIIRNHGYQVINSDKIGHDLMEPGQKNYNEIVESFGKDILNEDKTINRTKLGEIVFSNKDKLELLNKISHKNIFNKINCIIHQSFDKIIFIELPILIELKKENKLSIVFDEIWLVYVNPEIQIKRLIERNDLSEKQAKDRIGSQMSIDEKLGYADFIINNEGSLEDMEDQINKRLKIYENNR